MKKSKKGIVERATDIITLEFLSKGNRQGIVFIYITIFAVLMGILIAPHFKPFLGIIAGILIGYLIFDYVRANKKKTR